MQRACFYTDYRKTDYFSLRECRKAWKGRASLNFDNGAFRMESSEGHCIFIEENRTAWRRQRSFLKGSFPDSRGFHVWEYHLFILLSMQKRLASKKFC